jgi:hypothetical protein
VRSICSRNLTGAACAYTRAGIVRSFQPPSSRSSGVKPLAATYQVKNEWRSECVVSRGIRRRAHARRSQELAAGHGVTSGARQRRSCSHGRRARQSSSGAACTRTPTKRFVFHERTTIDRSTGSKSSRIIRSTSLRRWPVQRATASHCAPMCLRLVEQSTVGRRDRAGAPPSGDRRTESPAAPAPSHGRARSLAAVSRLVFEGSHQRADAGALAPRARGRPPDGGR